jgi:hypothetical protein
MLQLITTIVKNKERLVLNKWIPGELDRIDSNINSVQKMKRVIIWIHDMTMQKKHDKQGNNNVQR